jgi:NAD(P)-dependent dehydrogenase (short-subunit alcohol dehydrogenase family)
VSDSGKTVLCLGGTSDIGRATALAFAARGWTVQLAGRDREALQRDADDIAARSGTAATVHMFDVLATGSFGAFIESLQVLPDTVVCVIGLLGDQTQAETDLEHAAKVMRSNYEGPALILGLFAERFVARGNGTIIGVSSVAGDRGRASNYVYGSAKAGLTAFLAGLRNRLAKRGVHVVTVKPGFVRTKMTEAMALPGLITANPEEVGKAIFQAAVRGKDVIYVRPVWLGIMTIIRLIPERLFKKLKL